MPFYFFWFTHIFSLTGVSLQYRRIVGSKIWIRFCFFHFEMNLCLLKLKLSRLLSTSNKSWVQLKYQRDHQKVQAP